ncbi:hypothetical protein EBZ38_09375 [bacterium]|nr:hypothetical protein [bacterium]NDC94831.1 hypothetical protein [bacterium]NDD84463.1 hypothetical protein [bacterium]
MAWESELTTIVRTLVNDLDEPYDFTDARIQQVLAVAGKYVQFDVNLDHSYSVDVVNGAISPDPTEDRDEIFISLVCLKAACIIDQGTFRTKAVLEGVKTQLGPASIAFGGSLTGWQAIIDHGACGLYQELTDHWDVKNASAVRAILSPFVGNKFDPRYLLRGPIRDRTNNDFYS